MSAVKHYLLLFPLCLSSAFIVSTSLSLLHTHTHAQSHTVRVLRWQAFATSVSHAALYLQPGEGQAQALFFKLWAPPTPTAAL